MSHTSATNERMMELDKKNIGSSTVFRSAIDKNPQYRIFPGPQRSVECDH
jgi:hypothetical protein